MKRLSRITTTTAAIPEVLYSDDVRRKITTSSLDLYERLFGYGEKPRRYLEMELRDGVSEIAILHDMDTLQVFAFCVFYRRTLPELFIDYLGVSPASQGGGLGSRLLRGVIDHSSRIEGLQEVSLFCSEGKIPFYKKVGFEKTGKFADLGGIWYRLSKRFQN